MTKNEAQRIKLLEIIKKDTNKVSVAEVVEIFCGLFFGYFDSTKTGRKVKEQLEEDAYISYCTGFCNTFLSSLYVNAAADDKEFAKRLSLVTETNKDLGAKVVEYSK